jgi:Spy/CpxP family protein refolding chaperone
MIVMSKGAKTLTVISGIIFGAALYAADPLPAAPQTTAPKPRVSQEMRPVTNAMSNLTPEQRTKYQEANQRYRQEQTPLYEKLRTARRELEQAIQAENLDEKLIRDKAEQIGRIEGDLAVIRAKHSKELRTIMPQGPRSTGMNSTNVQFQQRLQSIVATPPGSTNTAKPR